MQTQSVELSDEQAKFIRESVDLGRFQDAGEVLRAGLRLLERQEQLDRLKLERLRRLVQEGFDEIDRGEFETITPETLDDFMDSVSAAAEEKRS